MNWAAFITYLLEQDLKISSLEAERLTSIRQQVIDRWKNGKIGKPQRQTIRRLETGLKIQINDSNPDEITYTKTEISQQKTTEDSGVKQSIRDFVDAFNSKSAITEYRVPLSAGVPAGSGEIEQRDDVQIMTIDSRRQFALIINRENGDSMQPFLQPGDVVICDTSGSPRSGDIVAARWSDSEAAIKILGESLTSDSSCLLYSYNPLIKPIIVDRRNTSLYKVVMIKKGT